jgi:predicted DNA-binding ribbon-helix-helix protein
MEKEFWDILLRIRAAEMSTVTAIVERIDLARDHGNLSSAVRLYVLKYVEQEGGKWGLIRHDLVSDGNGQQQL